MRRWSHRSVLIILAAVLAAGGSPVFSGADSESTLRALKQLQQETLLREPAERMEELERLAVEKERIPQASGSRRSKPAPLADDLPDSPPTGSGLAPLDVFTPSNIRVNDPTGEPWGACQSEVSIAAHGNNLVAAWNDGIGIYGYPTSPTDDTQGYGYSSDGGLTWTDGGAVPNDGNFIWSSDPVVAVNEKTGEFWYSALFNDPRFTVNGVAIAKGTFSGGSFSWGPPKVVHSTPMNSNLLDKPWMAVDSLTGNLYVTFSNFAIVGGQAVSNSIQFARSLDNGQTWTSPMTISAGADAGLVQGSRPAVGPEGEIYAVWYAIGQSSGPNTNSAFGRDFLRIRKSTDAGASFGPQITADSVFSNFSSGAPGFNRGIGLTFPAIAVDRSTGPSRGRVYLSWNESLNFYNDPLPVVGQAPARREVENNNVSFNATPFVPGDILRGVISVIGNPGDLDYWRWNATQGQTTIFYLDSLSSGLDASFRIFCSDGTTLLAFSQNGHGGQDLLVFTAPTTATYFARVASYTGIATGGYRILTTTNTPQADRARDHRDIFVKSSANGTVWSATARVNDDPGYFDDWLPEVQVDPQGRVFVADYDWRDATAICGGGSNVYLYRSDDGGANWLPGTRMTDFTTNWTQVYSTLLPNQGDYIGLFAGGAAVHVAWADGRSAAGGNADPDVYFATAAPPTGEVIARAGNDTTVECSATNGTLVRLDGTSSGGAGLRYAWSAPGVVFDDPTSPTPTGRFLLGMTAVELQVSNDSQTSRDTVMVTIVDRTAPTATLTLSPASLWPPNHRLAAIHCAIVASDACDPSVQISLVSVTSSEPDAGLDSEDVPGDIQGADLGTADFDFSLRSERAESGSGRTYTVCYEVRDAAGNAFPVCGTVDVIHDQSARARFDASGRGALLLFGSPNMQAVSFDPHSLEVGAADFRRWHPAVLGVATHQVDGDPFEDVLLSIAPGEAWVTLGEPLWARWQAGGADHLARLEPGAVTGIGEEAGTLRFACSARPNPGPGGVTLGYTLPRAGHVRLAIYDVAGHQVARLVDRVCAAGVHQAPFVASSSRSAQLYLYRIEWAGRSSSGKFVVVP